MRFSTRAIHSGQSADPSTGSIMVPIYQTSTYVQKEPGVHQGFEYSRTDNPTRNALEENLASLEEGRHGICFGSGLAATDAVLKLLAPGDHVVAGNDLYGGTFRLFTQVISPYGIEFTFVDASEPQSLREAIRPETRLVWLETPTNPLLKICDIAATAEICKEQSIILAVDNTFSTPYLQRPIPLGADLVVHSTTKYLGGHSDVIGGVVITSSDEISEKINFIQNAVGAVPGPMDCFLTMRGTKTLAVRLDRHCENAGKIVEFLNSHPAVSRVYYPGLSEHPGHEIAARQMSKFGGMISFVLEGESESEARAMVTRTRVFSLAESLGGVESLIEHPVSMTHGSIPPAERKKSGLSDGLIRLSVGIEDVDDLLEDLDVALGTNSS